MINKYVLTAILLSSLVTWLPRVLPFLLLKLGQLPDFISTFLKYLPVSIVFALLFSSLWKVQPGRWSQPSWAESLVSLLCLYLAFRYKNLLLTVFVGVLSMAVVRFFF